MSGDLWNPDAPAGGGIIDVRGGAAKIAGPPAPCVGCGAPSVLEAIVMPTDAATLFALVNYFRDEPESWPSARLCDPCTERTAKLFRLIAGQPANTIAALTNEHLALLCRVVVEAPGDALDSLL